MILREYINLLPVASNHKEMREWGKTRPCPPSIDGKVITNDDINLMSFANYMLLASVTNDKDLLKTIENIFSIDLYHEQAYKSLGFIMWMVNHIERINKLFSKVSIPPTEEERMAGVERLRFGFFGIIDWFARRMGIDHDRAEQTAWVRIYKCLEMETKTALYERRLMRVRMNKQKAEAKKKHRK